jgi:hypothetical protein
MSLTVISANQRSTRLSQEALVGVKCRWKRGCLTSQFLTVGALWVERLSQTRWTSRSAGTALSIAARKLRNSLARCWVRSGDDPGGGGAGDLERREEVQGAGADVVVGDALRRAGHHRDDRLGPVQGLHLGLLIYAEHRRPFGRVRVEADDVAEFVDELRVGGQLECLLQVRLEPEGSLRPPTSRHDKYPNALHTNRSQALRCSHMSPGDAGHP